MDYRTIPAGRLLDACIRARGYDPDTYLATLSTKEREWFSDLVNEAWREVHQAEMWPHYILTEQRQYRPTYSATETYDTGKEVFYGSAYYRCLADGVVGIAPTSTAYWEASPDDFLPYIQYDQYWESNEIDAAGVDFSQCVYEDDPLAEPDAAPVSGCRPWQFSILVPATVAPTQPYVRFKARCPELNFLLWAAGTLYARGEVRFLASTQECYMALRSNTGQSPDTSYEDWWPVRFPADWKNFARWRVAAQLEAEQDGRNRSMADSQRELDRLRHVFVQQTGLPVKARYRSVR